jgi:hypothetical protein
VRTAFQIVAGRSEGKEPFGTYKRIWNSIVEMERNNLESEILLNNILNSVIHS